MKKQILNPMATMILSHDEENRLESIARLAWQIAEAVMNEFGVRALPSNDADYIIAVNKIIEEQKNDPRFDQLHPVDKELNDKCLDFCGEIVLHNIINNRPDQPGTGVEFDKLDDKAKDIFDANVERILELPNEEIIDLWEKRCSVGGANPKAIVFEIDENLN